MTGILQSLLGSVSSAAASATDAFFNLVTLLLPGNGTNGAQNNTFLDSSTNNFTITRNGNTTQGTFSPFSQTGWSTYFSGSPYLETPSNAAFSWGTGDFSMEFQVYVTTGGVLNRCLHFSDDISNLAIDSSNRIELWIGSSFNSGSYTVTPNTWAHVVATRVGSTLRLFLNGMLVATTTSSFNKGTGSLQIGGSAAYTNDLNGYLSGVRLVKGGIPTAYSTSSTTVGTQIFTPPTAAFTGSESLTAGSVSFLGLQQNRWIDLSANAFAITVNGTPSVQAFSPFAPTTAYSTSTVGGSGYFDGNGDVLNAGSNAAWAFGTGNFTVECWCYLTSFTNNRMIIVQGTTTFGLWVNSSGQPLIDNVNVGALLTSSISMPLNAWTHIAAVRSGTTLAIYVNGASGGTVTNSTNFGQDTLYIGGDGVGYYTAGYLSGVRILKGTAQYTAAFTPPTSPPTNITNTSLLLNFTNAGITDATAKNDLETVGNAQISTTQSKFGGSSMYFDGTGDYLLPSTSSAAPNFVFGTGDFTIEMWVYITAGTGVERVLIDFRPTSTDTIIYPAIIVTNANVVSFYAAGFRITGTTTVSLNTWHHIAVSRSGTSTKLFLNGTQEGSTYTDSNNYTVGASRPSIACQGFSIGSNTITGYIDDLRITKGYARYTANFTPPTAAFALQ